MSGLDRRAVLLHLAVIAGLVALQYVLPDYYHVTTARILVFATFALGFNILFGYTGLLSLGHALFFAAGMYGTGLLMRHAGWPAALAFPAGIAAASLLAAAVGLLALRTSGVAFMIVTMMFAQAGYLTLLYFNEFTRGDEGFVIDQAARAVGSVALSEPGARYFAALALFGACLAVKLLLVRSYAGRVLIAIRENEDRATMLGYNVSTYKLLALIASGAFAGAAGAAQALLFGAVGATFASIQYSILPLLWVLLGGAGVVLGPLLGVFIMFHLIDKTSEWTDAYLLLVGGALVLLVIWFPRGILGTVRARWVRWLP